MLFLLRDDKELLLLKANYIKRGQMLEILLIFIVFIFFIVTYAGERFQEQK